MAKINRKDVYPDDLVISMLDFLLGSDANNLGQTKSYPVQRLADLFLQYVQENVDGLVQDNRFRFINAGITIGFGTDISTQPLKEAEILNKINDYLEVTDLTVTEHQLIVFVFDVVEYGTFKTHKRKYLFPNLLGKGVYNPLSSSFSASDLEVVFIDNNFYQANPGNIENNVNNVVFDLGDITGQDYLTFINTIPNVIYPSGYPLTDNSKIYYYKFVDDGVTYMYYFDEANSANSYGAYGVDGDFTFISTDLVLFYQSDSTPITPIGSEYQTKIELAEVEITDTGVLTEINVGFENSSFRFIGAVTEIRSFSFETEYIFYPCKEVIFKNFQSTPFIIKHLSLAGTGTHQFFNGEAGIDLVVKPGEIVKYSISDVSNRLELMSINRVFLSGNYYTTSEIDAKVLGLWNDRGNYNPNTNSNNYPSTGGSGTAGAILKGDIWTVSGLGSGITTTIGTQVVQDGDTVRALINTPAQTESNWALGENNIGYVPENTINKKTTIAGNESSTTFFGVIKAWIDWFKDGLASQIPAKTTAIVDNDRILHFDSEDGNKTKYRLWSQIKATLKTYFDGFYETPQINIVTAVSIDTTTTVSGIGQKSRNVVISNGANNINYTINASDGFAASFVKNGTGSITFVQGSARTMVQVDGTAVLNGSLGSTATISSVGTVDYLRISNA